MGASVSVLTEIAHANMYGDIIIVQHVMNRFAATRGPPPEKSLDAVEPFSQKYATRRCCSYAKNISGVSEARDQTGLQTGG